MKVGYNIVFFYKFYGYENPVFIFNYDKSLSFQNKKEKTVCSGEHYNFLFLSYFIFVLQNRKTAKNKNVAIFVHGG